MLVDANPRELNRSSSHQVDTAAVLTTARACAAGTGDPTHRSALLRHVATSTVLFARYVLPTGCRPRINHAWKAHAAISGSSSFQNESPCDPTRSVMTSYPPVRVA